MSRFMKYIVIGKVHDQPKKVILFDPDIIHSEMARTFGKSANCYSAGFVIVWADKDEIKVDVQGISESLMMGPMEGDAELIRKKLNPVRS